MHEDGRFLYPGTGARSETGRDAAVGKKLNVPMPPGSDDDAFLAAWEEVEGFIDAAKPELILLQCGADSIAGDPITRYTPEAHARRAASPLADKHAGGKLLAMGGGGYSRREPREEAR